MLNLSVVPDMIFLPKLIGFSDLSNLYIFNLKHLFPA